jgi:hypothetical protein
LQTDNPNPDRITLHNLGAEGQLMNECVQNNYLGPCLRALHQKRNPKDLVPDQYKKVQEAFVPFRCYVSDHLPVLVLLDWGHLTVKRLEKDTILYKATKFKKFDAELAISSDKDSQNEWAGQYFASDKKIAEGYKDDYCDDKEVYLHTFRVKKEIPILYDEKIFSNKEISEKDKSSSIKNFLINNNILGDENTVKINHEEPLMPTLAKIEYAYNGPHDEEGNREIIIGGELLKNLETIESEKYIYKNWEWEKC